MHVQRRDETAEGEHPLWTIIIDKVACAERDALFGSYLAAWDAVQELIAELTAAAMKKEMWDVAPVIYLGLNVNSLIDLILGYSEGKLNENTEKALIRYLDSFKVRNAKRNRIVHGGWHFSIKVGRDTEGRVVPTKTEWARIFRPSSASKRKKLHQKDAAAVGECRFTLHDTEVARAELNQFCEDSEVLVRSVRRQLEERA